MENIDWEQRYNELVEVTATRISQGEDSGSPNPKHYLIPGTEIQLIDVIHSKMTDEEWRRFLWGSALQYVYRLLDRGDPVNDASKAIVYLTWFKESYK